MKFKTKFLKAARVGVSYTGKVEATDGIPPYAYSAEGELLEGLLLEKDGKISGVAKVSTTKLVPVTVTDSSGASVTERFVLSAIQDIALDTATVEQEEFVSQLQEAVAKRKTWSVGLASQTSQTLIELISAVGTYEMSKITRAYEEAFAETAQTDSAKLAIAKMKGLRISRKLPATLAVTLIAEEEITIEPFTQFLAGPLSLFNSESVRVTNTPTTFVLKEGHVKEVRATGKGTPHQSFVANETPFAVSDQDVQVIVGGSTLHRNTSGLWNCGGVAAFTDDTLVDGRLHVQFGDEHYGSMPGLGEEVIIRYAVTLGYAGNKARVGATVTVAGHPGVTGKPGSVSNGVRTYNPPSGGMDQKSADSYALGSYGSSRASAGVNKLQYNTIVNDYPGVIDALILAQRELGASDPRLMNTLWVTALTATPWGPTEKEAYCQFIMGAVYGPQVKWKDPIAVPVDIELDVYCAANTVSVQAVESFVQEHIENTFRFKRGLLQKPFYKADLVFAHKHIQRVEVEAANYIPGTFEYCTLGKLSIRMHHTGVADGNYV